MIKMSTSTFIEQVDSFFTKLFSSFKDIVSFKSLGVLIAGIIIGFIIATTIYGISILKSVNKKDKNKATIKEINDVEIKEIVEDVKTSFVNETEALLLKDKFNFLGHKIYEMVLKIANKYYPESKYPLYELTIEELMMLLDYIIKRVDNILDKKIVKLFKQISIAQVFVLFDKKKQIEENKAVKLAKKANDKGIVAGIKNTLGIINPVYWLKKLANETIISFGIRKICLEILDIVAEETIKTYSKSLFNETKELKLLELEKEIEELEKEELNA